MLTFVMFVANVSPEFASTCGWSLGELVLLIFPRVSHGKCLFFPGSQIVLFGKVQHLDFYLNTFISSSWLCGL